MCQSQQNSTSSIQKYISEVPPHPWHTIGSDLFYFRRIDFLVVVDYFSKYLIMRKIPNSTSSAVIKELGMIFSEFGKPQVFRSDNGPCYLSQEFRFFMQNWSIEHRTSSPHYPHSNGLAESMVKVSKNLIEKAILQDLPWNQLLLDYRCTPISSKQFQVAKLPVQWMPFPQYPQQRRTGILHPRLPGHHPESTKEFHLQGLDYKNDISSCTYFLQ